jgi:hypothetical protein
MARVLVTVGSGFVGAFAVYGRADLSMVNNPATPTVVSRSASFIKANHAATRSLWPKRHRDQRGRGDRQNVTDALAFGADAKLAKDRRTLIRVEHIP